LGINGYTSAEALQLDLQKKKLGESGGGKKMYSKASFRSAVDLVRWPVREQKNYFAVGKEEKRRGAEETETRSARPFRLTKIPDRGFATGWGRGQGSFKRKKGQRKGGT